LNLPTYPYTAENFDPPALVLEVEILHPNPQDRRTVRKKALIDTGADGSVIPAELRDEWNLNKTGEVTTVDFRNEERNEPTYDVRIVIKGLISKIVEVTVENQDDLLLGRDILNELKMCANGKSLLFTLEDP
jgi:predicted aspartyl protease